MAVWEEIRDRGKALGKIGLEKAGAACSVLKDKGEVLYGKARERVNEETAAIRLERDFKKRLTALEALPKEEMAAVLGEYLTEYASLPSSIRPKLGYRLAALGASRGHEVGGRELLPDMPFSFCGWGNYMDASLPGGGEGLAFRIRKPCFGGRNPRLYYRDQDGWPREGEEKLLLQIEAFSSGICDVKRLTEGGFSFRLDPRAKKSHVLLSKLPVETGGLGGYVLILPRAGEFDCELGEILAGEKKALHRDSYCMK